MDPSLITMIRTDTNLVSGYQYKTQGVTKKNEKLFCSSPKLSMFYLANKEYLEL